jgi:hypothetical protein
VDRKLDTVGTTILRLGYAVKNLYEMKCRTPNAERGQTLPQHSFCGAIYYLYASSMNMVSQCGAQMSGDLVVAVVGNN